MSMSSELISELRGQSLLGTIRGISPVPRDLGETAQQQKRKAGAKLAGSPAVSATPPIPTSKPRLRKEKTLNLQHLSLPVGVVSAVSLVLWLFLTREGYRTWVCSTMLLLFLARVAFTAFLQTCNGDHQPLFPQTATIVSLGLGLFPLIIRSIDPISSIITILILTHGAHLVLGYLALQGQRPLAGVQDHLNLQDLPALLQAFAIPLGVILVALPTLAWIFSAWMGYVWFILSLILTIGAVLPLAPTFTVVDSTYAYLSPAVLNGAQEADGAACTQQTGKNEYLVMAVVSGSIATAYTLYAGLGLGPLAAALLLSGQVTLLGFTAWNSVDSLQAQDDGPLNEALASASRAHIEAEQLRNQMAELHQEVAELSAEAKRKSRYVADLSMAMRTPMNALMAMVSLLIGTDLSLEQTDYTRDIEASAEDLMKVIRDMTTFTRSEVGDLILESTPFLVPEVVHSSLVEAARAFKQDVELVYFIDPKMPIALIGDESKLKEILIHVLHFCAPHVPIGSETVVYVQAVHIDGENLTASIMVGYRGDSIPEDHVAWLVSSSASPPSSSHAAAAVESEDIQAVSVELELALATKLVQAMRGKISVESSSPDKPTVFIMTAQFTLNSNPPKSDFISSLSLPRPSEKEGAQLEDVHVLIVDNSTDVHLMIVTALQQLQGASSIHIDFAQSCDVATENVVNKPYHVIFLDLGLTGAAAFASTVQQNPDRAFTTLLVMTPIGHPSSQESLPSYRVISKPLHPYKLASNFVDAVRLSWKKVAEITRRNATPSVSRRATSLKPSPAPAGDESDDDGPSGSLRILVAEDDRVTQRAFSRLVTKLGHSCVIADNGKIAVEKFDQGEFDVIFMDCNMPVMDGFEATKAVRILEEEKGRTRKIPIIALTASASAITKETCLSSGMDAYLSKPLKRSALEAMLEGTQQQQAIGAATQHTQGPDGEDQTGLTNDVLLVEDNLVNAKIAGVILRKAGLQVEHARNGKFAVDQYCKDPKYGVILMDIHMPVLDGLGATRKIREYEKDQQARPAHIIALTADTGVESRQACLDAGCDDYISKPVDYVQLLSEVARWTGIPNPQ